MTVTERVSYLKGLFEGLEIDTGKKEGKLLSGMLAALDDLAQAVTDLKQQNEELLEELDDVYEELSAITEDFLLDDADADQEELAPTPEEDLYQVVCPTCGEVIYLDQDTLSNGSIVCSACGEELEFDLSGLENDDET
nr:CD1247 N-terminal domain-containing protein [uncultured Butyricicoccus sp.]